MTNVVGWGKAQALFVERHGEKTSTFRICCGGRPSGRPLDRRFMHGCVPWTGQLHAGQVDIGFGFDDEEGVGVGAAGGAEFLAGFVERVG